MKKLLLTSFLAAAVMTVSAESVTIKFDNCTDVDGSTTSAGNIQPLKSMRAGDYSFVLGQDGQTKPALWKADNTLRIYAGATMQITGGIMAQAKKITLNCKSIKGVNESVIPVAEGYTATFSANDKTITYVTDTPAATFKMTVGTEKVDNANPNIQIQSIEFNTDKNAASADVKFLVGSADGWDLTPSNLPEGITYVWKWESKYGYLKGSAFNMKAYAVADQYAVSPAITVSKDSKLTFDHAAFYKSTITTMCGLAVREVGSNTWNAIEVKEWPSAGSWTFVSAGEYDLSAYAGKNIQIGLKYGSTEAGADDWEIKNMVITNAKTAGVGYLTIDGDADAPVYYYDMQGIRVDNPEKGMFIRVQGKKATKVYMK